MEIQINKKYRLVSLDANNIGLQKLGKDKDGADRWDNLYYYGNLTSALRAITDSCEFVHNCKDLEDLKKHLDRIDEIKEEFKSILHR